MKIKIPQYTHIFLEQYISTIRKRIETKIKEDENLIHIDFNSKSSIYEQICSEMNMLIAKNILKENEKLPSTRILALQLNVNPNTVARAYRKMEIDGTVNFIPGKGYFVAKQCGTIEMSLINNFKIDVSHMLDVEIKSEKLIEIIRLLSNDRDNTL